MSETLVGESWSRQTAVGILPLTSAEQWFHPRPLMRCGHKPGLSNELFCVPLLTSHTTLLPAQPMAQPQGSLQPVCTQNILTGNWRWWQHLGSVTSLRVLPLSLLKLLYPTEPSVPCSVLFLVLPSGSPAASSVFIFLPWAVFIFLLLSLQQLLR